MARSGFMKIFWGLLCLYLVGIAPGQSGLKILIIILKLVGYTLVFVGLGSLSSLHPKFSKAKVFAAIMVLLSLGDFLKQPEVITLEDGSLAYSFGPLFAIIKIIGATLGVIMIWYICGGVIELALASENQHLAKVATTRRNLYVALAIIFWCRFVLFLMVLPKLVPETAIVPLGVFDMVLVCLLAVFGIVVLCLMLGLMKRASRQIS